MNPRKTRHSSVLWPLMSKFLILMILWGLAVVAWADTSNPEKQPFYPQRVREKPKIDGILDEKAWETPYLEENFVSYSPLYGETLPYKTRVWMAYDNTNLYFAFLCYDPEPQKIKTSITKRDNMYNDDWIGLSLDALGNKQRAYALFVNPNGIQGDMSDSAASGTEESPDFVWESAGKITHQGYQVEISLPLKSISFHSGKNVKMGILFWRKISRLGYIGSWPEAKPGQGVFNTHTTIIYKSLKSPLKLEILPSITYSNNRQRVNPEKWGGSEIFKDFGIGIKYGITSSINADITIHPDFSQVESDAFQVEVNRRYPLFYSEKRPFFMEGMDIFSVFTIPNGYFPYVVHTRLIVDPLWGIKLTGNVRKISFGILAAGDEWPGQDWVGDINPNEGKNAFFGIARGKYSLGKDNYIGVLYNSREFAGKHQRVSGIDFAYRIFKNQRIFGSFLINNSTALEDETTERTNKGMNKTYTNFYYFYKTKKVSINAAAEHIGSEFNIPAGFLLRNGLNQGWAEIAYSIHPRSKIFSWLKQITPLIFYQYLHDLNTGKNDTVLESNLDFDFIKEGYFGFNFYKGRENWKGISFRRNHFFIYGGVQLTRWLNIGGELTYGDKIYYDALPPFSGTGYNGSFSLELQPIKNFNQYFIFSHDDFSRAGEKVYNVNIFYSRTTYQFNKYFFLRTVLQYDSYQKRMLTDFLASFTLIPGTVLHVGYGGLYESRKWHNDQWLYGQGDLMQIKRSFFFKASYLWRL